MIAGSVFGIAGRGRGCARLPATGRVPGMVKVTLQNYRESKEALRVSPVRRLQSRLVQAGDQARLLGPEIPELSESQGESSPVPC